MHRFLARLWRLKAEVAERTERGRVGGIGRRCSRTPARDLLAKAHWAIDKVTRDIERDFQFNTAIAAVMELVNEAYRRQGRPLRRRRGASRALRFATATAASLLFPFAPHLGCEVYEAMAGARVWEEPWPKADPALLEQRHVHAGRPGQRQAAATGVEAAADASEEELLELARRRRAVQRHLDGKEIVKEIVVPGQARQPRGR